MMEGDGCICGKLGEAERKLVWHVLSSLSRIPYTGSIEIRKEHGGHLHVYRSIRKDAYYIHANPERERE